MEEQINIDYRGSVYSVYYDLPDVDFNEDPPVIMKVHVAEVINAETQVRINLNPIFLRAIKKLVKEKIQKIWGISTYRRML